MHTPMAHTADGSECPSLYRSAGRVCRSDFLGAPKETRTYGSRPGSEKLIFRLDCLPCFADTPETTPCFLNPKRFDCCGRASPLSGAIHHSRSPDTYRCAPIIARSC